MRVIEIESEYDPYADDPRFAIGPVDTEITPFATAPLIDHPKTIRRVARSSREHGRFFTTTMCYDDAMDFIDGVVKVYERQNKSVKHWRLVHGVLKGLDEHYETWGHAWVERGDTVYESRFYKGERVYSMHDKAKWYGWWEPLHVHHYTVPEAYAKMRLSQTGNAGPWDSDSLKTNNRFVPLKPFT